MGVSNRGNEEQDLEAVSQSPGAALTLSFPPLFSFPDVCLKYKSSSVNLVVSNGALLRAFMDFSSQNTPHVSPSREQELGFIVCTSQVRRPGLKKVSGNDLPKDTLS